MIKILKKILTTTEFLGFFLVELVLANLKLARDTLGPTRRLSPGVVAVPLDLKDHWQITALSNLITLTPGSLSLDVSLDRGMIYIHTMDARNAEEYRQFVKRGLERRVKELFS